ncbi:hypothetical protein [Nocardioides marmoribigeumensis]|uniref:Lipoprotein n=1 Tax=Nocardioides marmoribigeumensis TaxID=433649 RepID=A0ABU2BS06_9ACTN|nr:hypothetical protein [Nocardioides marmoribigeumensis]MDR7361411.1 hypothetical protein [Nocardioides marmoribigeumensis]
MTGWTKRGTTAALVLLLPLAGLASCGEERPALSARECRSAWEDLRQTQSENGSIAPRGTRTAGRWQQEYDVAGSRAKGADPGDLPSCSEDVAAARARFDRLVDLGAAIQRHDLAEQLRRAEADLRHAQGLGSFAVLPPRLATAFDRLRSVAPEVHQAVARAEQPAADVDLDDGGAVHDLAAAIGTAATSLPSYAVGRRALEVIGRYELHEE